MHTLVLRLQKTITDFMDQRDALWLRVACSGQDAPIVFKLLLDLERRQRGDVFLLFGAPFFNPEQYAAEVLRLFLAEWHALDSALAAHHGPPLGRLPERFLGSPAQQLAVLIRAARELLPQEGEHRLVLGFWPLELSDPAAYEQLLDSLLPLPGDAETDAPVGRLPQWLRRVRLIGRAGIGPHAERRSPGMPPYMLRTESDFSPPALQRCMQELIADPQCPPAARLHTLLMLAAIEEAHGGWATAIAKYEQVLAHFRAQPNPTLHTVALLQLGALYHRQKQLPAARACYEQALIPAAAARTPVCVAMLAKNLGDVAFLERRYDEAAACYQAWQRLASRLGDSAGATIAQQQLTLAQQHLGAASGGAEPTAPPRASR